MSVLIRLAERNGVLALSRVPNFAAGYTSAVKQDTKVTGEFRVLELIPKKVERTRYKGKHVNVPPPRANQMAVDQDWVSVWPGPRSFHPAVVPIPVRQGYPLPREAPPSKWGNAELMKIPNFLHLTPPAVKRHCEALKQFCTPWPKGLETQKKQEKNFPIQVITSDYCYAGPSIRDPLARIVSLRVKLSALKLDAHAKDKILRLLGDRYDFRSNVITITADRCPVRKQNLEYAEYLMTAVYHEAWRVEPWEAEKTLADMEYYDWDKNASRKSLMAIRSWPNPPEEDLDYETIPHATNYKTAVSELINDGENDNTINKYREAVKPFLHLKPKDD